jgi:STE24 endopeptidase
MTANVPLDQSRQQQAREYAQLGRKLMVIELAIGVAYVLLWIFSGLSPWLRDQIYQFTPALGLALPLFALGFGLPYTLIDAPLSYYSGFVLPHRYGQSTQSRGDWLADQLKGLALSGVIGVMVLGVIYGLLAMAPQSWWLWATAAMLIFSVLLGTLAPVLIFPLFFKYTPLADEELAARLTRLSERAGARVKGVYAFDMSRKTVAANAALMGLGSTRRIILGDTLLSQFTHDEIETVLAHELGHHVHHDLPLGILVQAGLTLAGFWLADAVMRWGVTHFGYSGLADPATLPLLMVALSIFGLVTMPLSNAWSRWREVLADRYALETTANPPAFINAMTRLANQNLADAEPPAWVEFLLHSHPSIHKRVALAQSYQPTTTQTL